MINLDQECLPVFAIMNAMLTNMLNSESE
jgi:hypothetical protein